MMFVRRATVIRKNRRSIRRPNTGQNAGSPAIALTPIQTQSPLPYSGSNAHISGSYYSLNNGSARVSNAEDTDSDCVSRGFSRPSSIKTQKNLRPVSYLTTDTTYIPSCELTDYVTHNTVDDTDANEFHPYSKLLTDQGEDNALSEVDYDCQNNPIFSSHIPLTPSLSQKINLQQTETTTAYDFSVDRDYDHAQYDAFLLQIKEISRDAENSCEFVTRAYGLLCSSIMVTILLGLLMSVPVAMMGLGVKYLSECPRQPKVPIYLLVGGCFGLLFLIILIWRQIQHRRLDSLDTFDDITDRGESSFVTDLVLGVFQVVWLILGTVWVFSEYPPRYEPLLHEPSNYCNKNAYLFAVIQILGCYILLSLAVLLTLSLLLCYKCITAYEPT